MIKTTEGEVQVNISFRLYGAEAARWKEVLRRAFQRDVDADKTDVIKALLGLPSAPAGLVDASDISYFQGREGRATETIDVRLHTARKGTEKPLTRPKRNGSRR